MEDEKYLIPSISSYSDFWRFRNHTLIEILNEVCCNDLGLRDLADTIGEWIEAWTKVDILSGVALTKNPGEDKLENQIDEFIGKLVELQLQCKDSYITKCEEKIIKLEEELSYIKNLNSDGDE